MRRLVMAITVLACACPPPAFATFPGKNGKVFFSSNRADPHPSQTTFSPGFDTYRMNADGTVQQRLTGAKTWPFSSYDDGRPAVSPNGRRVAVVVTNYTYVTIYLINRDGTNQVWYGQGLDPAWSPDGNQIAYTSTTEVGNQLTVMNADGSHRHLVAFESQTVEQTQPDWSPDGTRIAFVRRPSGANAQIATVRPDGTGLQILTSLTGDEYAADPSWSPDGNVIAFSVQGDDASEVSLVNADGSAMARVTHGSWDTKPSWAPNGRRIAFASNRESGAVYRFYGWQIYTMKPNGTGIVRITNPPADDPDAVLNREPFWDSQHGS